MMDPNIEKRVIVLILFYMCKLWASTSRKE